MDFVCIIDDIDKTYTYEITKVELTEREIPILEKGKIDIDTLEYHFGKIYRLHNINFNPFSTDIDDKNFPYIEEIKYGDDSLIIKGKITQGNNSILYDEEFNTNTMKLKSLSLYEDSSNSTEFTNKILSNVAFMRFLILILINV